MYTPEDLHCNICGQSLSAHKMGAIIRECDGIYASTRKDHALSQIETIPMIQLVFDENEQLVNYYHGLEGQDDLTS